ncbi:MAG: 50S ribosomal protein L29 [Phycisphaeraceae bacterium]|nr:50S ribosomal protein L29 [Phycisphaeraceae bacterium]
MKASEVRDMKAEELPVEVTRLRQKLFELRSQAVTEKLENPMQLKEIRRDIARLLTERRRRELKEAS